jgi:hypothetical protein
MVQTLSIRTKLIMAMLALVASVALMGVTAADANAAGVTEIRWVENHTRFPVYVENHEPIPDTQMLVAPYTARSVNQRIPWVFNASDFDSGHYIELGYLFPFELPRHAIWQENRAGSDKVRYSRAKFALPIIQRIRTFSASPHPKAGRGYGGVYAARGIIR